MTVLETMTDCPEKQDGLARFERLTVLKSRTSLYYHTHTAAGATTQTVAGGMKRHGRPDPATGCPGLHALPQFRHRGRSQ